MLSWNRGLGCALMSLCVEIVGNTASEMFVIEKSFCFVLSE